MLLGLIGPGEGISYEHTQTSYEPGSVNMATAVLLGYENLKGIIEKNYNRICSELIQRGCGTVQDYLGTENDIDAFLEKIHELDGGEALQEIMNTLTEAATLA